MGIMEYIDVFMNNYEKYADDPSLERILPSVQRKRMYAKAVLLSMRMYKKVRN